MGTGPVPQDSGTSVLAQSGVPGVAHAARDEQLLERDSELATGHELIEATRKGAGAIVVVEGQAGIGKTRLLQAMRARALTRKLNVMSARGSELERDFAFGIVRQLFEPLLFSVEPGERLALLDGAARLATRVLGTPDPDDEQPSTATLHSALHGLYWLSANVAARGPLLISVDDAHWADAPSLRFLAYLANRLEGLPILVALGTRTAEGASADELLQQLLLDSEARVLHLAPLSEAAVERIVRSGLGPDPDGNFITACHELTRGNPFLLFALLGALRTSGTRGTAADTERLRTLTPLAVSRAVLQRLARLPDQASRLAGAAAVLGDDAVLEDASALAGLNIEEAAQAADQLAQIEILRPGLPLQYAHPVIRAAVYADIAPTDRALRHARVARLLAERNASDEQVAAHLLEATPSGDGWAVEALTGAAQRALSQGAPDIAATYLRRALAEPRQTDARADLLLQLGLAEARTELGGTDRMADALGLSADPVRRGMIALALGRTLGLRGHHGEAVEVLERALAELSGRERQLEARLEAELLAHCLHSADKLSLGFERLKRVDIEGRSGQSADRLVVAIGGFALTAAGRLSPAAAASVAHRTWRDGGVNEEENSSLLLFTAETLVFADYLGDAGRLLDEAIAEAHRSGSTPGVALASAFRSQVALRRGALADAEADARLALELVDPKVLGYSRTYVLSFLVDALTERGEYEEADRALAEAGRSSGWPQLWQYGLLMGSRGRLRVAQGQIAEGLADLLEWGQRVTPWRPDNPLCVAWRSDAALAHALLRQVDQARELAQSELRDARRFGAARGLGISLRVAGLVEGGEQGLELLRESAAVLDSSGAPLEHARALTDLGAALRRRGCRSEARAPLRRALEGARQCDARPLAKRAHEELVATGARPRRLTLSGVESLTPSERRVVGMAAEGLKNREVAQALFVTEKTVQAHLTRSFRKLDITSRSELSRVLGADGDSSAAAHRP